MTTTAAYDSHHRSLSAQLVEEGDAPALRMRAPALTFQPSSGIVIAAGRRGGVRIISKGSDLIEGPATALSTGVNLSADDLATAFTSTALIDVLFVDRRSLAVASKLLGRSDKPAHARLGRTIAYLGRQPCIHQCSVLTSALSRKYWVPTNGDSDDLTSWAQWMRLLAGPSAFSEVPRLVALASDGEIRWLGSPGFRSRSTTITSALLRGRRGRIEAYTALSTHGDMWKSVESADPLLLERGLLDGSTARLVPTSVVGASVIAEVSTPFKLRPGNDFTLFGPTTTKGLPIRLDSLSFDPVSERLTAKLTAPAPTGRRSTGARRTKTGLDEVSRSGAMGATYYGTATPYSGSNWQKPAPQSDDSPAVRELPLDVALAAAD